MPDQPSYHDQMLNAKGCGNIYCYVNRACAEIAAEQAGKES